MTKKSTENRLQEQACLRLIWLCVRSIGQEGMHNVELNWCVFIHLVMSLHHSSLHVITFCGCVVTPRCLWYLIWPVAWLARFLCFNSRPVFKDLLRLLRISLQCSLSLRASCHCGPGLVVEVVCWYGAVGYRIPHPLACLLHPLPLTDWLTDPVGYSNGENLTIPPLSMTKCSEWWSLLHFSLFSPWLSCLGVVHMHGLFDKGSIWQGLLVMTIMEMIWLAHGNDMIHKTIKVFFSSSILIPILVMDKSGQLDLGIASAT